MPEPAWKIQNLHDCFYCHKKEYKPNLANHYCDDCVVVCPNCNTLKGLWCFPFDYATDAYKEWKAKGTHGILPIPGHTKMCGSCIESMEADPIQRLRRAASRLKPGQLELMLKATGKTET